MDPLTIYTIGHSTLSVADFIARLRAFGVARLVDVRTIPKSRHNPQFNRDELARKIRNTRVGSGRMGGGRMGYIHLPALGGLRHARKDSINAAWRNASFRGYADYMQTPEFSAALERLIAMGKQKAIAIMCAESVPWRCHRSLIADALTARHIRVLHIMTPTKAQPHRLTPWAKVAGHKVWYPG
jgi:uncharacterized protein (DUF488 family)